MDHLADRLADCVISSLVDQLRELVKKNNEIKQIEKKLEELKEKRNMYQESIYSAMLDSQVGGIKVDGKTFYPQSLYWASIPENIKAEGLNQLIDMGLKDLIKSTVNSQTLSATIRQMIAEGKIKEVNGEWFLIDQDNNNFPLYMKIREDRKIGIK